MFGSLQKGSGQCTAAFRMHKTSLSLTLEATMESGAFSSGYPQKTLFSPQSREVSRWGAATYWPHSRSTAAASGGCEDRDEPGSQQRLPPDSHQGSSELSDLCHGKRKNQVWLKESISCCVGVQLTRVNKYVTKLK